MKKKRKENVIYDNNKKIYAKHGFLYTCYLPPFSSSVQRGEF